MKYRLWYSVFSRICEGFRAEFRTTLERTVLVLVSCFDEVDSAGKITVPYLR